MKLFNQIKLSIKNFIYKLGKANEKNLGSQPLDCCTLNKNQSDNK